MVAAAAAHSRPPHSPLRARPAPRPAPRCGGCRAVEGADKGCPKCPSACVRVHKRRKGVMPLPGRASHALLTRRRRRATRDIAAQPGGPDHPAQPTARAARPETTALSSTPFPSVKLTRTARESVLQRSIGRRRGTQANDACLAHVAAGGRGGRVDPGAIAGPVSALRVPVSAGLRSGHPDAAGPAPTRPARRRAWPIREALTLTPPQVPAERARSVSAKNDRMDS